MNLSQLKYVKAVAETSSFSRASERCFVTQPSLSNAVAQLEDELGGRFFFRTTHHVSLTPFGERMMPHIAAVLDAQAELERTARSMAEPEQKLARIGFCPLVNLQLLSAVIEPFKSANKDIEVVLKECFVDDLRERLELNKIDLLLVPQGMAVRNAVRSVLYSEELCFLPRAGSPLYGREGDATLEQISDEVFTIAGEGCGLAYTLREMFRASGYEFRQYAGQAVSYSVLEDWASLGVGATILPRSKVSGRNAKTLLAEKRTPASITIEAVWNKRSPQPAHIKDLLRYFKKVAPEYIKGMTKI